MLSITEQAVKDRAHAALILLSPRLARELDPGRREQVSEYLLGQQSPAEAAATRDFLAQDEPANAWARAVHAELSELDSATLPGLAAGPQAPARSGSGASSGSAVRSGGGGSSRRGGAILLAVLVAVVIVAVVLISGGGGKGGKASTAAGGSKSSTSTSSRSGSSSKSGTAKAEPHVDAQLNLTSPVGSSAGVGVAYVISDGKKKAFYLVAEHLAKTEGFFYAVWLEDASGKATPLGETPSVSSNGRLRTAGPLPSNPSTYTKILLTHETDEKAKTPGEHVLEGAFKLS